MKQILKYSLLLALIVLVSSTTVQVMTVKPEKPANVFVKQYDYFREMKEDILQLSKKGWIVKGITTSNDGRYASDYVLIMEKY